jgi:hypothetical protein
MKIQHILVAGGLLFIANPSLAAGLVVPTSFCASAKNLQSKSKGCEDNGSFTQAAKKCMGDIDVAAKKLGLDIKALERTGAQSQRGDMKKAAEEYFQLTRKLDYIIGLTEVATIDVYNYAEHIFRPEDEAEKEEDDMQVPCFGDNVEALENIAKQLQQKQKQFEKVLDLTVNQLMQTQANIDKTETMGSLAPVAPEEKAQPAPSAPVGPKGKDWNGSDISGTKKKETPAKK